MIESITVMNHLNDVLELTLRNPYQTGIVVKSITGLGPGKASINTSAFSMDDGTLFNSARLEQRNIVITLGFLPVPTIEDVRLLTYKHFPIKKPITLFVLTDNRLAMIEGYVESNEPDIFSKQESTTISIVCPKPHFTSVDQNIVNFSTVRPTFEFPMENASLMVPTIELSTLELIFEKNLPYSGDQEAGVLITINAMGASGNITIHNTTTLESMTINTTKLASVSGGPLASGDTIYISTVRGDKFARLLRGGSYTNILNCLDKNTDWFQLTTGDNLFSYTTTPSGDANNLRFRVDYQVLYSGV